MSHNPKLTAGNSHLQITLSRSIHSLDKYSPLHDTGEEINKECGLGKRTGNMISNLEIDRGRWGLGEERVKKICTGLMPVAFQTPHLSVLPLLLAHVAGLFL